MTPLISKRICVNRDTCCRLPKEPAALANVLEVSVVDFLLDRIAATDGQLTATRGGERVYPDLDQFWDDVGRVYADVDPELHPAAELSVRAHLVKLVREGKALERDGLFAPAD